MARLVVGSALVNSALLGGLLAAVACSGSEESPAPDTAGNAGSQAGELSSGGASGSGMTGAATGGLSGKGGSGGSSASGGLAAAGSGPGASGAGNGASSGGTRAGEAGGGPSGKGGTADPGSGGANAGAAGGAAGTGETAGTAGAGGSDSAGASGSGGANSGGGSGPQALSFEADIWPMFAMIRDPVFVYPGAGSYESCVTTGVCHGGMAPGARLSMPDAETAYGMLLDVPSESDLCDGTIRVVAGEPEQSCLVLFYEGRLREELDWVDAAEIDRVRQWIADGALP